MSGSMFLVLLAAIAGLFVGPTLHSLWPTADAWRRVLDGFAVAAVGGLCILHLLPEAMEHGGVLSMGVAVVGMMMPRLFHGLALGEGLLLVGLGIHAALESAALSAGADLALGVAIVLHRLPVGLVVFGEMLSHGSTRKAWLAVSALAAASGLGFGLGAPLLQALDGFWLAQLQALVAGMLLHVAWDHGVHAPSDAQGHSHEHAHDHEHSHEHAHSHEHEHATVETSCCGVETSCASDDCCDVPAPSGARWAALGAFVGAAVVYLSIGLDTHGGTVGSTFLTLALESAPALMIAYILAGLFNVFSSPATTRWLRSGGSFSQALKGVGFGLPLPICSCGVLPMYRAMIDRGVPAVAAMGFLIATPELGIDALFLSIPLLGTSMSLARLGTAFLVAVAAAMVVGSRVPIQPLVEEQASQTHLSFAQRIRSGLGYGLGELFDHTMPWVLLGLVVAALAEPLLSHTGLGSLSTWVQVPLFALIGMPMYVCASGATPIAAIAIYSGISPGAALAFLLAGPATNITTFGVLSQLHGRHTAARFAGMVTLGAIVSGWSVNLIAVDVPAALAQRTLASASALQIGCLLCLTGLFVASLLRQGPRGMIEQITRPIHP